jgi:hypothetical protein
MSWWSKGGTGVLLRSERPSEQQDQWGPPEVLAHVAEMLPRALADLEALLVTHAALSIRVLRSLCAKDGW